jgi:hypothetical protein
MPTGIPHDVLINIITAAVSVGFAFIAGRAFQWIKDRLYSGPAGP